jgi:hypothetical protein
MRVLRLAPAALAGALLLPAPALAQAPEKPVPRCGPSLADPAGDTASQVPTQVRPRPPALDITRVFLDHAPGTAGATTINVEVTDLSTALPTGTTGLNWTVQWTSPAGPTRFVRAVTDYLGSTIFEFGEVIPGTSVPAAGAVLPRYEPRGQTVGRLFPGPQGIVQIAIPDTWDGALGTRLADLYAQASEARQVVPNAVNSPTRGLSQASDRAPDGSGTASWTIAPSACAPPEA